MTFLEEVLGNLSPGERDWRRRTAWIDRLTSLWTPVTLFVLVFIPYIFAVEMKPCSHQWLQPLLKGYGLLLVGYYAVLVVAHGAQPAWMRLRTFRHRAFELYQEIARVLDRNKGQVSAKVRAEFLEVFTSLERSIFRGEVKKIQDQLDAIRKLRDAHLTAFRAKAQIYSAGGFISALIFALSVRAVLIEPFKIPSGSMIPTLEIGDQIFVNKLLYGVRVPWINKIVPFQIIRAPMRGDVIVFNNPVDPDKDFVKRVVGIPGDVIELKNKQVFINGVAQPTETVDSDFVYADETNGTWQTRDAVLVKEKLGDSFLFSLRQSHEEKPYEGPYRVPDGHVFVMGDNRDNSSDSRYGLGVEPKAVRFVPYGNIKGKAMVIWYAWGYKPNGIWGQSGLRTERLFQPLTLCESDPPPSQAMVPSVQPTTPEE